MLTKYIGLISQTRNVPLAQVSQIAAAIQKQLTRDFYPIWQIPASIQAFAQLEDLPTDYWPIIIMDNIGEPGAAGVHLDRNGQPYALVQAGGDVSLTCSHECLEMLADPFGNRFVASDSIKPGQGRVNYLVEICDPSEADNFAYRINGIVVSDFYTPNYFDPVSSPGVRYSFSGAVQYAKQLLPGGYISWMLPGTGEWWQANLFGSEIEYSSLGVLDKGNKSWRELIDGLTFNAQQKAKAASKVNVMKAVHHVSEGMAEATAGRSAQIKNDVLALLEAVNPEIVKVPENRYFLTKTATDTLAYNVLNVIRIVLDTAGHFEVPATLPGIRKKLLDFNLGYTPTMLDILYFNLLDYFNTLKGAGKLSNEDVSNCDTIGDVVDVFEEALSLRSN